MERKERGRIQVFDYHAELDIQGCCGLKASNLATVQNQSVEAWITAS